MQRLGWIYKTAILKPLAHGWVYLLLCAGIATLGLIWGILLVGAAVGNGFAMAAALMASNFSAVGWLFLGFIVFMLIATALLVAAYNGGMIRLLAPVIHGRRPDPLAFVSGAFTLAPRLFMVFLIATLIASIPLWWVIVYLWEAFSTWGPDVLESGWNSTLRNQVIHDHGRNLRILAGTIMAVNILLGPWQALIGIRRISLFAALPVVLGFIGKNLLIAVPVIAINALIVAGLESLAGGEYATLALILQLFVSPMLWLSWIALLAPLAEAPAAAAKPRPSPAPVRPAPTGPPPGEWRNPVPGLLPGAGPNRN